MDASVASRAHQPTLARDLLTLTKPEISFLVGISAMAGFLLGSPTFIDWVAFSAAIVGVVLTSAGGAVLNHVIERHHDARMKRTASRPIPQGRLSVNQATWFGLVLIGAGLGILCPLTNPLTGVLAAGTVLLYLFVYTPMKRVTSWNTVVGTIPGALPALGGWTAATGDFGAGGWALFFVLVFWQIPHFYSLAWMYRADYARADFAMLPVRAPDGRSTAAAVVAGSVLLVLSSLTTVALGLSGWIYGAGALGLGLWFLAVAIRFARSRTNPDARKLLKTTVYYIPLLLGLIAVDRLL